MTEIESRRSKQPAPPWVIFEDLCEPHRQPARPWLHLLDDEMAPEVVERDRPGRVVWSSLWRSWPDVRVRFDLAADGHGGTDLRWTLFADDPLPDAAVVRSMRARIDRLVNANLRHTYGQ
ncbi:hypothetical protein FZI95_26265 [Mycobacterium sp. CBMA247]|nr:hypothetical protein [Mycolicibacterium sp. CBMA 329]MUL90352.1 hypothetical protein [Mycolicibacterium sp. CBMA 331]MUM00326.1 hypothetical protein [Mycolicibacterium sp. CBMA 334]MUM30057.1 hypothetical protein [Mycolicibacterium sp. CBMA 295]MUM41296.1 hypothetical protein [Mycolicibacterium sp. CBMA 247]MUM45760.1 hypothetical protein [Mycolicibacterium sp. CBMA 294]